VNLNQPVQAVEEFTFPELFAWRELAIGGLILMDLSWGLIWVEFLAGLEGSENSIGVFLVLSSAMIGTHLLSRTMSFFRLKVLVQRALLLVFLCFLILAGFRALQPGEIEGVGDLVSQPAASLGDLSNLIPAEFVIAIAILIFARRGIGLAQEFIGPMKVLSSFRLGFLMFLGYILLATTLMGISPGMSWIVFLAAGMIALASSRVALLALIRGGRRSPFNREWVLGLGVAVGLAILLAAGFAILLSGVGGILLGILFRLVVALLYLLLFPLVLVTTYALTWLIGFLQLEDSDFTNTLTMGLERLSDLFADLSSYVSDFSWILEALTALWFRWGSLVKLVTCSSIILFVGLVAILQLRELNRRRQATGTDDLEVERINIGILGQLARALRDNLTNRLRVRRPPKDLKNLAAARVRQIYFELSDLSSSLGTPRRRSQTPHEYLPDLESVFVNMESELNLITDAYVRVRYGELPEDESELQEVEVAWASVEAFGRRRLKAAGGSSA
ncbi:MAG TPA: DUF4129 domain-containing protein, partial [Anaerolineales bacterium]|nr:DUF4129 domain-containing protein [Anaerolineales bacterium]